MTLSQTIRTIELVAAAQPSVNMIVRNDVFRLSEKPDARYGVFAWTQGSHSGELDSSLQKFAFTLFYVDRLTANEGNETEVQSVGVQTLTNIVRALADLDIIAGSYTFQPFTERFHDNCAGVFCTLTLDVPVDGLCVDVASLGGDYNNDFNEDFLIM